jgi:pyruvate ferredoxin oxidoreductase gamma subunit
LGKLTEIRWHGRGGQGAKTASQLLAEAASAAGMYVQGFPEYGPERMGAPIQAFNRYSDQPIALHCHVTEPDVVAVLDPSLLGPAVIKGLSDKGALLVNTSDSPATVRAKTGLKIGRVYTVDASTISVETIGRDIPNTPMMGALIKATDFMPYDQFMAIMRQQLEDKFKSKPSVIEGNLKAIQRAYEEVQSE